MKTSEKQMISTRRLVCYPNNPRKITQESLNRLCDSIRDNGYWKHRPAAVEPIEGTDKYWVLDGNQRLKALRRMKRTEMPCVIYEDLTDDERNDLILRSNINNGEWEVETLRTEFELVDFEAIGLEVEIPEPPQVGDEDDTPDEEPTEESPEAQEDMERLSFYYRMMGDYRYPSDNDFDIPTLSLDNQPVHLELPFTPWGVEGRYKKGITTYHFYVDDYRFERLFKDPVNLLMSGCRAVVEPNCSIHDQTPAAFALFQIYKKRYLARYLQECGLQIWVDLNVSHHFMDYNLLGVPKGYNAFFTRGVSGWQTHLDLCLEKAQQVSGLEHPNLCVYGGGKDIEQWCRERTLFWTPEYMKNLRDQSLAEQYRSQE